MISVKYSIDDEVYVLWQGFIYLVKINRIDFERVKDEIKVVYYYEGLVHTGTISDVSKMFKTKEEAGRELLKQNGLNIELKDI